MQKFNKEFAALVLVTALYFGDKKACEQNHVSRKTLYNYRERLSKDVEFTYFFQKKKSEFLEKYEDTLAQALDAGAQLIIDAAREATPITKANPEFIHAIAGAIKICGEVLITRQLLKGRLKPGDAQDVTGNRTAGSIFRQNTDEDNELPN